MVGCTYILAASILISFCFLDPNSVGLYSYHKSTVRIALAIRPKSRNSFR
jgi:hypothetical protein